MTIEKTKPLDLTRKYTIQEFEALDRLFDQDENTYELIDGEIVVTPPPGYEHGSIADEIYRRIVLHDPERKLGRTLPPTRFSLSDSFGPGPDLAFIVADRVPPKSKGAVEVVPDLVLEVWSPSQLTKQGLTQEAQRKIELYQQAGVRIIWSVNPAQQTVEVYHPDQSKPVSTLSLNDELDGEDVIPGLKIPVKTLFV
jgi:Uma2 family endonuclease